jgi:hypothetical protein
VGADLSLAGTYPFARAKEELRGFAEAHTHQSGNSLLLKAKKGKQREGTNRTVRMPSAKNTKAMEPRLSTKLEAFLKDSDEKDKDSVLDSTIQGTRINVKILRGLDWSWDDVFAARNAWVYSTALQPLRIFEGEDAMGCVPLLDPENGEDGVGTSIGYLVGEPIMAGEARAPSGTDTWATASRPPCIRVRASAKGCSTLYVSIPVGADALIKGQAIGFVPRVDTQDRASAALSVEPELTPANRERVRGVPCYKGEAETVRVVLFATRAIRPGEPVTIYGGPDCALETAGTAWVGASTGPANGPQPAGGAV